MTKPGLPIEVRFWMKVDVGPDCWEWTKARRPDGYGAFAVTSGKTVRAHRWAYEWAFGPIPEGLVIDHLCRNPGCVKLSHLEAVTQGENVARGESPFATHPRQAVCKHGHPLVEGNVYVNPGSGIRACRTCRTRRNRERRARLRAQSTNANNTTTGETQ